MLTRICSICGREVEQGKTCPCLKERQHEYDRDNRDKSRAAFYNSRQWELLQKSVAARAGYVDEYLKAYRGRIDPGRIAHHIAPIADRPDLKLDGRNIVYVSDKTHRMIHETYKKSLKDKETMMRKLYKIRMDDERQFGNDD